MKEEGGCCWGRRDFAKKSEGEELTDGGSRGAPFPFLLSIHSLWWPTSAATTTGLSRSFSSSFTSSNFFFLQLCQPTNFFPALTFSTHIVIHISFPPIYPSYSFPAASNVICPLWRWLVSSVHFNVVYSKSRILYRNFFKTEYTTSRDLLLCIFCYFLFYSSISIPNGCLFPGCLFPTSRPCLNPRESISAPLVHPSSHCSAWLAGPDCVFSLLLLLLAVQLLGHRHHQQSSSPFSRLVLVVLAIHPVPSISEYPLHLLSLLVALEAVDLRL